jgi:hypothetical protein
VPQEWPVTQYTWTDDGARVTVVAPLAQFGSRNGAKSSGDAPEKVTCLFTSSTFDLCVTASKLFRLRVDNLPAGGIRAEVRLRLRRCLPRLIVTRRAASRTAITRLSTAVRIRASRLFLSKCSPRSSGLPWGRWRSLHGAH